MQNSAIGREKDGLGAWGTQANKVSQEGVRVQCARKALDVLEGAGTPEMVYCRLCGQVCVGETVAVHADALRP